MGKEGIKFAINEYLKIDDDLSKVTFDGISVTGVVGHFLKKGFFDTPYFPNNLRDNINRILFHFRFSYYFLYNYKRKSSMSVDLNRPYWFIVNSTDIRFIELIMPVINQLGRENCVIFSANKNFNVEISDMFYSYPILSKIEFYNWKLKFGNEKSRILPQLQTIKNKYHLSSFAYKVLRDSVMYQTQLLFQFAELIKKYKPKSIVTDADRHSESAALISTANYLVIPTFCLLHGSVFPADNWIPFISKKIFCWGQITYKHLKPFETSKNQLVITGNPKITSLFPNINNVKITEILGSNENRVILISNNIPLQQKIKLADDFAKATLNNPLISSFIRLHPTEHTSEYESISSKYKHIKILNNDTLSLNETIYAAKIIVINNSTVGLEALIKKRNVIVLDTVKYDIGLGNDLSNEGKCLKAKSADELTLHIQSLLSSADLYDKQISLSKEFINQYCAYLGIESARRICDLIK